MSLAEYKRLDVCILGFVWKLMRGAATSKTVTDAGTKYPLGTRAMAVDGLVSFCEYTSHCSPGSLSTCVKLIVWLQGLHCCTVW